MEKTNVLFTLILTSIVILGCSSKTAPKSLDEVRIGNEGIAMAFLPNSPPDQIRVDASSPSDFEVVLEVKNKGAYPQPAARYS